MGCNILIRHLCVLAAAFLLSLGSIGSVWATPEEGAALRSFLRELVDASAQPEPQQQAERVRQSFAHHPEIFGWISKNRDLKELLADAGLSQFQFALDLISPKGSRASDVLSGAMAHWLSKQGLDRKATDAVSAGASRVLQRSELQKFLEEISKNRDSDEWMRLLRGLGDAPFIEISRNVDRSIEETSFADSPALQALTDPNAGLDIQGVPKDMKELFSRLLGQYFDALPAEKKKRIVTEILELPPSAPVEKQISIALNNSGPALQKTFQLFGKDAKSPAIRNALEELKSNIEPFDVDTAKKLVAQSLGRPFDEVFASIDAKPLGAGTVGQAHLATLKSGKQVVLKIRRPGVVEQAKQEIEVFRKLAQGSRAQEEVVNRLEESLLSEMSFVDEARNTGRGGRYNSAKLGLASVSVSKEIQPHEDLLALDFAPGKPLSKLSDAELVQHGQALTNLLQRWVDESVFESGFFHGDLHSANLLFLPRAGEKPPFKLTIIDFGSADILSLRQRRASARLMAAILTRSKDAIVSSLADVAKFPGDSEKEFREALAKADLKRGSLSGKVNVVLQLALESGAEIPASLLKYNRGRMFLEGQLDDVNARLERLDPEGRLPRFASSKTYVKIGAKGAVRDLTRQIFGMEHANRSVVTTDLVMMLAKYKASEAIKGAKNACAARFRWLTRLAH